MKIPNSLAFMATLLFSCCLYSQTWTNIGPTTIPDNPYTAGTGIGTGRVNVIEFHPNYDGSTNKTVLCGTSVGGVWQSTNGGNNWSVMNTDKDLKVLSIADIKYNPLNPNSIFVATGDPDRLMATNYSDLNTEYSQSRGIYKSENNGESWEILDGYWQDTNGTSHMVPIDTFWSFPSHKLLGQIAINPHDSLVMLATMYVPTNSHYIFTGYVYKTVDGGANWYIKLKKHKEIFRNMEYNSGDTSFLYVSGIDTYRSIDGGESWVNLRSYGLYSILLHPICALLP